MAYRYGCAPCLGTVLLCGGILILSIAFMPAACWLFIIGLAMALEGYCMLKNRRRM